jgi:FixJ family two-component response regulator
MSEPPSVVFVVDDGASIREGLGRRIRSVGLQVEIFGWAQEFLQRELP